MVRSPSIDKNGMKKGAWSEEEDNTLRAYVEKYGHWNWRQLPKYAGLSRCGKSCRLRWLNYLKPGLKKGLYTKEEEDLIVKLRVELGNKWSIIASHLPGRTDNEVKNHWHTHLQKRITKQPTKSTSTQEKSYTATSHGKKIIECDVSNDDNSVLQINASFSSDGSSLLDDKSNSTMVSPSGSCNSTLLNTLASIKTFAKSSGGFFEQVPAVTFGDYYILESTIPTPVEDFQSDPFLNIEASNYEVSPEDYEVLHQILSLSSSSSSSEEDEGVNLPLSPSADQGYDSTDRFFA